MSSSPNRRPVKLRLEVIGPQVGALIIFLFVLGLVEVSALLWFILVSIMISMHTILFYRLGRIAERMSPEEDN